jgi:hypothetical protein
LFDHGSHFNKKNLCVGRGSQNFKLANLNSRKTGNTGTSKGTSSGANPGTRGERGNQEQGNGGDDYGGIRGFLFRALHQLRLTQCILQMSTGRLWYSNFLVLNRFVADFAS